MTTALPTCENCGRLLNRVTGKCPVCDNPALAGAPPTPPPAPVTEPAPPPSPPGRPAATEPHRPAAPVTTPRSLWEDPPAPVRSTLPAPIEKPPEPPPEPAGPRTTALGVIGAGRMARRKVDVYVFEGALAIVKAGSAQRRRQAMHLTKGQVSALDPGAEFIDGNRVREVDVAEGPLGGQLRVTDLGGQTRRVSWSRRPNRDLDVEKMLQEAFPGKVDLAAPAVPPGLARLGLTGLGVAVAAAALWVVLGMVFEEDPPPPPPPPTTTTLSPAAQQIQGEMAQACPAWRQLFGALGPGARPDPAALRAVTAQMRPRIDTAVALDPAFDRASSELRFLEGLASRPAEDLARESAARIDFAADQVTGACDQARA